MGDRTVQSLERQNNPSIRPLSLMWMPSAARVLGRPGIVIMSPQVATTNSAPADSRSSRTDNRYHVVSILTRVGCNLSRTSS